MKLPDIDEYSEYMRAVRSLLPHYYDNNNRGANIYLATGDPNAYDLRRIHGGQNGMSMRTLHFPKSVRFVSARRWQSGVDGGQE
jgi:hypothetical protein